MVTIGLTFFLNKPMFYGRWNCLLDPSQPPGAHAPLVKRGGLVVFPVAEDLDVGVQGLDRILALSQLSVQGITVSFGIHGVESLHSSRLVLDADLDLLQSDLGLLDLAVNLLRQSLESVGTGVNNIKIRESREKGNRNYLYTNFLRYHEH